MHCLLISHCRPVTLSENSYILQILVESPRLSWLFLAGWGDVHSGPGADGVGGDATAHQHGLSPSDTMPSVRSLGEVLEQALDAVGLSVSAISAGMQGSKTL